MSKERRQSKRLPYEVEVTLDSEHNFYTGFVQNVSEGGVFIATNDFLPIGSVCEFVLTLNPGFEKVVMRGTVRWVREVDDSSGVSSGMGLEFTDLHPDAQALMNRFIAGLRDSLFFDDDDDF